MIILLLEGDLEYFVFELEKLQISFYTALFCLINHHTLWLDKARLYGKCFTEYSRCVPCQKSLSNYLLQRHPRQCWSYILHFIETYTVFYV